MAGLLHWESKLALVLGLALGALSLSAPAGAQQTGAKETGGQAARSAQAEDQAGPARLDDRAISDAVERELRFDQATLPAQVDVVTEQGIVTLTGTTTNILAKRRAARIAETVRGVRGVVNRIGVAPARGKSEAELQADLHRALLMDPAAEAWRIEATVEAGGRVRLEGTVQSWPERELAEQAVMGVSGVTAVQNDIAVRFQGERADAEIAEDIRSRNRADLYLDDALVRASVADGKVTLDGVVGSAAEKRRATRNAWVNGVVAVDASRLDVRGWARDPALRGDKFAPKSDAAIASAIKDVLLYDPRVQLYNVGVDVTGNVATLRGEVGSLAAERAAVRDARNTVGVNTVISRIRVRPTEPIDGETLAERVKSAIARDPYIERRDVVAIAEGGTVNLYGTVDTFYEKARADDIAGRVIGVVAVENYIDVRNKRRPLSFQPTLSETYPYDNEWYDYQPYRTSRTDADLRAAIKDELWWSPYVDADEVTVDVDAGTATLSGTVGSWSEYQAASENAWEGGAVWVINKLAVRG